VRLVTPTARAAWSWVIFWASRAACFHGRDGCVTSRACVSETADDNGLAAFEVDVRDEEAAQLL